MADWGVVGICTAGGALAGPVLDRAARTVRRPVKSGLSEAAVPVGGVTEATEVAGVTEVAGAAGFTAAPVAGIGAAPGVNGASAPARAGEPVPATAGPSGPAPRARPAPADPAETAAAIVFSAALFGLCALRLGAVPALGAYCALSAALVCLSIADLRTGLLPRRFVYPSIAVVALGLVAASADQSAWHPLLQALIGGAAAFGVFAVVWLVFPRGMGLGDVRLAGLCGMALAWLGYRQLYLGFLASFVIGSLLGLAFLAVSGSRRFPFGPALAAGAAFGVLWGGWLGNLWLHPG